jgi:hypothetical protein
MPPGIPPPMPPGILPPMPPGIPPPMPPGIPPEQIHIIIKINNFSNILEIMFF